MELKSLQEPSTPPEQQTLRDIAQSHAEWDTMVSRLEHLVQVKEQCNDKPLILEEKKILARCLSENTEQRDRAKTLFDTEVQRWKSPNPTVPQVRQLLALAPVQHQCGFGREAEETLTVAEHYAGDSRTYRDEHPDMRDSTRSLLSLEVAQARLLLGDLSGAVRMAINSAAEQSVDLLLHASSLYHNAHNQPEAINTLMQAESKVRSLAQQTMMETLAHVGAAYGAIGEKDKARSLLSKCQTFFGNNASSQNTACENLAEIAEVQYGIGAHDDVRITITAARNMLVSLTGISEPLYTRRLSRLGTLLALIGDTDTARDLFNLAIQHCESEPQDAKERLTAQHLRERLTAKRNLQRIGVEMIDAGFVREGNEILARYGVEGMDGTLIESIANYSIQGGDLAIAMDQVSPLRILAKVPYLMQIARLASEKGDTEVTNAALERTVSTMHTSDRVLGDLCSIVAAAYKDLGFPDRGKKFLDDTIERLKPSNSEDLSGLAVAYAAVGQVETARKMLHSVADEGLRRGDANRLYQAARGMYKSGLKEDTLQTLEALLNSSSVDQRKITNIQSQAIAMMYATYASELIITTPSSD